MVWADNARASCIIIDAYIKVPIMESFASIFLMTPTYQLSFSNAGQWLW